MSASSWTQKCCGGTAAPNSASSSSDGEESESLKQHSDDAVPAQRSTTAAATASSSECEVGTLVDNTLRESVAQSSGGFFGSLTTSFSNWFKDKSVVNKFMFSPPAMSSYSHMRPSVIARNLHWVAIDREQPSKGMFPVLIASKCTSANNIVFYMHGNAEDLGDVYERCLMYSTWTRAFVCAIEYPGYGPLKGRCTERSAFTYVKRAVEDIVTRNNVSHANVVLFGRSIGSGVALTLAKHFGTKFGGFVLQSPFLSISDVVRSKSTLFGIANSVAGGDLQFTSAEYIKVLEVPLLILHGEKDDVIECEHSRRLMQLCQLPADKKRIVIDHNGDHDVFNAKLVEVCLRAFMNKHVRKTVRTFHMSTLKYDELSDEELRGVEQNLDEKKFGALRRVARQEWL